MSLGFSEIFPIFECDTTTSPPALSRFRGTGFRVRGGDLLITCWHCLEGGDDEGRGLAIASRTQGSDAMTMHPLLDVSQDTNGRDLGTARIFNADTIPGALPLELADASLFAGFDVVTVGFPDTATTAVDGDQKWMVDTRWLQGYLTRVVEHPTVEYGLMASYEMDMLAPRGISGAPLFLRNSGWAVYGVMYTVRRSATVEEIDVEAQTGERANDVRLVTTFSLAAHTELLHDLRGDATEGERLVDWLAQQPPSN